MDPRVLLGTLGEVTVADPAEIATRTGVDREHVAAALDGLARAGFVERDGACYRLAPETESEARELSVVSILLEGLAVRTAPAFDADTLRALRAANERLRDAPDEASAVTADDEFHRLLVAGCGNETLRTSHSAAKAAMLRYERVHLRTQARREGSFAEHQAVVEALEADDREAAAAAVRRNFESALRELTRSLDDR